MKKKKRLSGERWAVPDAPRQTSAPDGRLELSVMPLIDVEDHSFAEVDERPVRCEEAEIILDDWLALGSHTVPPSEGDAMPPDAATAETPQPDQDEPLLFRPRLRLVEP